MHYLRYTEKLKRKGKSRPLSFGSDFHKLLELRSDKTEVKKAFSHIKETFYDLDPKNQYELGDTYLEDLKTIFQDYTKVYKNEILPDKTEQVFDIQIGKYDGEPVIFTGVIDEIYELEDGLKIGEHKTFSRKPDMLFILLNTQKCLYAKAVQLLTGVLPHKVMWDYIKSTPAKYPTVLKSGKFSQAKNENITKYSWARACKEHGIKDKEILKKGSELYGGNTSNFFFRLEEEYIPEMVDEIFDGFKYTAKLIAKQGDRNKAKHTGANCSWCDYKQICYTELTGGNVEYVKKKDFEWGR